MNPSQLLCLTGHCENFTHLFVCDNFSLTDTARQLIWIGQSDFHKLLSEDMSWETECIFLQTRQFLFSFFPQLLSSSFVLQQFQENRNTHSYSEQAKNSWFNPSQLLSREKPWHETLFLFLSLDKPEYPGKIQELLRLSSSFCFLQNIWQLFFSEAPCWPTEGTGCLSD